MGAREVNYGPKYISVNMTNIVNMYEDVKHVYNKCERRSMLLHKTVPYLMVRDKKGDDKVTMTDYEALYVLLSVPNLAPGEMSTAIYTGDRQFYKILQFPIEEGPVVVKKKVLSLNVSLYEALKHPYRSRGAFIGGRIDNPTTTQGRYTAGSVEEVEFVLNAPGVDHGKGDCLIIDDDMRRARHPCFGTRVINGLEFERVMDESSELVRMIDGK